MGLTSWLRPKRVSEETRSDLALTLDEYVQLLSYGGVNYPLLHQTMVGEKQEAISPDFPGLVQGAYKSNGVVFACMLVRLALFSEARFQFRRIRDGKPGDLFGNPDLRLLETPWPNATTGDLLARMIQDADLAGNFFAVRRAGNRVKRLRPDWMTIALGSTLDEDDPEFDLDLEVIGYVYHPGGVYSGREPVPLTTDQVAHFAPIPDPAASYRGMSWLTPILREVMADKATTGHKLQFFENGATPNMVVRLDVADPAKYMEWRALFEKEHEGATNAYKTLFLGAGADATVVGANLRQLDFKLTQGAGETRIAAAAGVPPVIVGLSEGLQAATYSNYGQARRRLTDGTMRPLWRNAAGSLASIVNVPRDAELWYDDRDIPFLQEDQKDAAEIQSVEARTIRTLLDAGYLADSVVDAVMNTDWSRLVHSGLFSVQLQPPGASANGNGAEPGDRARDILRELVEKT